MQPKKIIGIILDIKPHKELDRLITVFSLEYGIIKVLAKGVKKITSRRGCNIDILNIAKMEIEESGLGEGGRLYLREIENMNHLKNVKGDPHAFASACVIASFLKRALPEHFREPVIFKKTVQTFAALEKGGRSRAVLLNYFIEVMATLGYLPAQPPAKNTRALLWSRLIQLDPEFALTTRRTLGIFSKLDIKRSN